MQQILKYFKLITVLRHSFNEDNNYDKVVPLTCNLNKFEWSKTQTMDSTLLHNLAIPREWIPYIESKFKESDLLELSREVQVEEIKRMTRNKNDFYVKCK